MKKYIFTITYNFDGDYIAKSFDTEEEAISELNKYLETEIGIIRTECEYEPSVLRWSDTDVTLVYAEGYTDDRLEMASRIFAREDWAEYRVFEVEIK